MDTTDTPGWAGELTDLARDLERQMPLLDAKRVGAELYGSPRFTAFGVFHPGETTLSRLIADLFDPRGLHGQGELFLNELLRDLGCPVVRPDEPVRVRREALTPGNRRIDLVIETRGFLIGMENKPWAGLSPRQLEDYDEALDGWKGTRPKILVLVSDADHPVPSDDVRILRFWSGDHPSLHAILRRALPRVCSTRVKVHVEEFIRYIEDEFGEGHAMDGRDGIYVEAVRTEFQGKAGRRKGVAAMLLAHEALHRDILDEVGAYLLAELSAYAPDIGIPGEKLLSSCLKECYVGWYLRRPSWSPNCFVGLSSEKGLFRHVILGVNANHPDNPETRDKGTPCPGRAAIEASLKGIPAGRSTIWWPWWSLAFDPAWETGFAARVVLESPTGLVEDHPEIRALAERLVELARAVDAAH
jgi:hypothetical protein